MYRCVQNPAVNDKFPAPDGRSNPAAPAPPARTGGTFRRRAAAIMGMGQSRISSHLAQLKRGRSDRRPRAGRCFYGLVTKEARDPARTQINELTRTLAREMPETGRDATALKLVLRKQKIGHANILMSWRESLAAVMCRVAGGRRWRIL